MSEPGLAWALGSPVPHATVMTYHGDRGVAEISGVLMPVQQVPESEIGDYAALKASAFEVATRDAARAPTDLGTRLGIAPAGQVVKGTDTPPAVDPSGSDLGDVRTLWVDTDAQNARHKPWRSVVQESYHASYPGSPAAGPSSLMYIPGHSERRGGNVRPRLDIWARSKNIGSPGRGDARGRHARPTQRAAPGVLRSHRAEDPEHR